MALQVKESPWGQKGQGPFHIVDFIQKMVSTNASSMDFCSRGLSVHIKCWHLEPKYFLYFHPECTIQPDPTFTQQETTKQPGCFAAPAPKPKTRVKELKSQAIHSL